MIISGGIIGGAVPEIIRTDVGSQNVLLTTFTFTAEALGSAGRRHIVISLGWYAATTLNSVTVAGVGATIVAAAAVAGGRNSAIAIASVPAGTTGNVVATFSGATGGCFIGIYALYNLKSATPVDTDTTTGATGSNYFLDLSADVAARGLVVAVFGGAGVTSVPAITGLSNEVALHNPGAGIRVYSADYTATAAETPRTMGWTLNGFVAGCSATFR